MRHKWRYTGYGEVECKICDLRVNQSQARRGIGRCFGKVEPKSGVLTLTEASDVETSREEIRLGKAKKFTNADELLKELKEGDK